MSVFIASNFSIFPPHHEPTMQHLLDSKIYRYLFILRVGVGVGRIWTCQHNRVMLTIFEVPTKQCFHQKWMMEFCLPLQIKGYKYGAQYVPIGAEDEDMFKVVGLQGEIIAMRYCLSTMCMLISLGCILVRSIVSQLLAIVSQLYFTCLGLSF